ncbi:hypothetical protein PISMIDRAFT_11322 [Pisolithus microcarpus 441]|uniref:HTH CENPB-type domain-containing protein n=1 Tax=Pisolithus microcarpus 441 TaxID=765257 RepID=A0A0C9ZSZ3_9AGAM|nr:hypothetical protein PISMIDRAFT_11322 [Pisolithus microcarpus 441]
MLDLWISKAMADKLLLTGDVIHQKWRQFTDLVGVPDDEQLKLSEGWLSWYKAQAGLKEIKRHGEAASAASETVDREQQHIQGLITKYGYQPCDIFNADESSLFYVMPPDQGLSNKQGSGVKGKKLRLTYLFVANADGSKKLRPLVIGKAHKPQAFRNKTGTDLGFYYQNNAKAWMTGTLCSLSNIRVKNFEPNLTAHVQPNDQGVIHCFKAKYRSKYVHYAIDLYDSGITLAEIYNINQLEAMQLADEAWNEVDTTTIQNCWQKAGILPNMDSPPRTQPSLPISSLVHAMETCDDPITQADSLIQNVLDDLEATGVLQPSN